ncbi:MAG: hypothetical protein H0V73_07185, partial [Chloroflexi bacterium]|nr:hypothetical protein [Chloroflexota bacterium]
MLADNVVNPLVTAALKDVDYASFMADRLAEADVDIVLGLPSSDGGDAVPFVPAVDGQFHVDVGPPGRLGMTQEPLSGDALVRTSTISKYPYVIVVQLSNPYTFRQTAIDNVT